MNVYFYFRSIVILFLVATHCIADVFDTIQDTNGERTGKYNMPLSPTIDPKDPKDLLKLSQETTLIDRLLTKNVNTKVHATEDQQKKALQAVFSTEIIYGEGRVSYLNEINETDAIYGHCYVLEYSALFARDCIAQMSFTDSITLKSSMYRDLCRYSGLAESKLFKWFMEMYNIHAPGIAFRSMNVGFTSESLTRQYGMEDSRRKKWTPTSVADEKNIRAETKEIFTREVKRSDTASVFIHSLGASPTPSNTKLFDAVSNSWVERDSWTFMRAVRAQNVDLLRLFVIHDDEKFLESHHLDKATGVALFKGDLALLRVLMLKRKGKTISQEGLDDAMERLGCENHSNVCDVLQTLFSPLAVVNPTPQGMNAAVRSVCKRGAVDVLHVLLSLLLPIKPTEHGQDDALLGIAEQRMCNDRETEKLADILDELFAPTSSVSPTQQGSDNAFLAASRSSNFRYIQYFIEYLKGIRPSQVVIVQGLTKLGDNYISLWECQAKYPSLIPYIKPYMSSEIKAEQERREHVDVIKARANEASEAWKRAQQGKSIPLAGASYAEAMKLLSGVGVERVKSNK